MHLIEKTHQTATGHRIPGHEGGAGKCARLHGHRYEFEVQLSSESLDMAGFVADFAVVTRVLDEWDHRLLLWDDDPIRLSVDDPPSSAVEDACERQYGIVRVPFVPTSENMAAHLAFRYLRELGEAIVFASVVVRESETSFAKFYATQADLAAQVDAVQGVAR